MRVAQHKCKLGQILTRVGCAGVANITTFGGQSRFGSDKYPLVSNFQHINKVWDLFTKWVKIQPNIFLQRQRRGVGEREKRGDMEL